MVSNMLLLLFQQSETQYTHLHRGMQNKVMKKWLTQEKARNGEIISNYGKHSSTQGKGGK
jgi:hypothetical protein